MFEQEYNMVWRDFAKEERERDYALTEVNNLIDCTGRCVIECWKSRTHHDPKKPRDWLIRLVSDDRTIVSLTRERPFASREGIKFFTTYVGALGRSENEFEKFLIETLVPGDVFCLVSMTGKVLIETIDNSQDCFSTTSEWFKALSPIIVLSIVKAVTEVPNIYLNVMKIMTTRDVNGTVEPRIFDVVG